MMATLSKTQRLTKRKSELECRHDQLRLLLLCKLPKRMGRPKIAYIMLRLGRENPFLQLIIISALRIEMTSTIKRMINKSTIFFRIIESTFKEVLLMDKMELIILIKMKFLCSFNQSMKRMYKLILKIKNTKSTSNIKSQSNNLKFKIMNFKNFIITN